MIQYVEKGWGMHAAIQEAGYRLTNVDGVWVASDEVAVQAIIDGYTIDNLHREKISLIDAYAKTLRDAVVSGTSAAEMSAWALKRGEAVAWDAAGPLATNALAPTLSAEAAVRGVPLSIVVAKCLEKAAALLALESAISGTAGKHGDAVRAMTSFDDVLKYNWQTGWPEI